MCRLASGEVPVPLEHQDERCVALRALQPHAPYHAVVLPRRHIPTLLDASLEDVALLGHLLAVGAQLLRGCRFTDGPWQIALGTAFDDRPLMHLHVHVLAGRRLPWPPC